MDQTSFEGVPRGTGELVRRGGSTGAIWFAGVFVMIYASDVDGIVYWLVEFGDVELNRSLAIRLWVIGGFVCTASYSAER